MNEMILSSAYTTWYWTYHKSDVPTYTLSSAIARTLRYHFGTIAFGSLFMPISRFTCAIFGIGSSGSTWALPFLCLKFTCNAHCQPFFEVLQRFNRNAYIMSAVYGKDLALSASDANKLIFRNSTRYITTDSISWIAFYIGKILFGCFAFVAFYGYYDIYAKMLVLIRLKLGVCIVLPLICATVGSYMIFDLFVSVYTVAVDTLALCARKYKFRFFFKLCIFLGKNSFDISSNMMQIPSILMKLMTHQP